MNSIRYKQVSCKFFRKSFSTSEIFSKSHYEALGVLPNCTQNDIKTAYYKLSKLYHPDKNKGSEDAADKFRDITTAYEVLGNLKMRKMYDKGILHSPEVVDNQDMNSQSTDTYEHAKFYHSRNMPPNIFDRGRIKRTVYNFDEWTQAHYGATFSRRTAAKTKYGYTAEENLRMKAEDREGAVYKVGIGATVLVSFLFYMTYLQDYDVSQRKTVDSE